MERDYYTVKAAACELGRTEEEVLYLIESRALRVCLFAKKRKFCVLAKNNETGYVNFVGTTIYRGLILIGEADQFAVFENENAIVKICIPERAIRIQEISRVNPFEKEEGPFQQFPWKELDDSELEKSTLYLHTFPEEGESIVSAIYNVAQKLTSSGATDFSKLSDSKELLTERAPIYVYGLPRFH